MFQAERSIASKPCAESMRRLGAQAEVHADALARTILEYPSLQPKQRQALACQALPEQVFLSS